MWISTQLAFLCLTGHALATQVPYHQPSGGSGSSHQQNRYSWQSDDLAASASSASEAFHPLTFDPTSQPQQNIQKPLDSSGAESVIDDILVSNRQGRALEGFDEVYADPDIQNALQLGNDTVARSYIRDKLCSLNLMSCDGTEERRPFYSPHRDIHPQEVIYAQPVTIKPVGRPLPAIPVKRPIGAGPLGFKPPGFGSGPIYSGGPPPSYGHGPSFVGARPPGYSGSFYKKPGQFVNGAAKPIYEDGEIDYDDKFIDKKQHVVVSAGSSVQQHVHHHYHHGNGAGDGPIIGPGPIGNNGYNGYGYGSGSDYEQYKKNFKVKNPSASASASASSSSPTSSNGYANNYLGYDKPKPSFAGAKGSEFGKQFGGSYNSFASDFGQSSNGFDSSFNSNNNNNNYDDEDDQCVCVTYDRCAALDQAGRKDDLYLAIDPRDLGKNIDAEVEEAVVTDGNGTMTVVRVTKATGSNETEQEEKKTTEDDKRAKRDTSRAQDSAAGANERKNEAQSRLLGQHLDTSKLNVKPTFGVSFGLPQSSYPINGYGGDSPVNPYPGYGAGGGAQGINLGPVSVNPLVALQVTKDDYGDKVIKPLVNFHISPNEELVRKFSHLLANKKEALFGNHYPHHQNYYAPQYHQYHQYPGGGSFYDKPTNHHYPSHYPTHGPVSFQRPSHYQQQQSNHYHQHQHQHNHYHRQQQQQQQQQGPYGGGGHHYDYDGEGPDYGNDYDYYPGFYGSQEHYYRNARTNVTAAAAENRLTRPDKLGDAGDEDKGQTGPLVAKKVNFPDNRRKRDAQEVSLVFDGALSEKMELPPQTLTLFTSEDEDDAQRV